MTEIALAYQIVTVDQAWQKNARAERPTKTNKCLLRMLESVIKVVQRTHWHMKTLRSPFHTVKIIPNRSMAVFTLTTDYLSETENPSSKSVKVDGKTDE